MVANSFYTQNQVTEDLEMVKINRAARLINKYQAGTISLLEKQQLDDLTFESESSIGLFEKLRNKKRVQQDISVMSSINTERAMEDVKNKLVFTSYYRSDSKFYRRLRYAVIVLIGFWLGIGAIFLSLHATKGNTGLVGMYFDRAGIELSGNDNDLSVTHNSDQDNFMYTSDGPASYTNEDVSKQTLNIDGKRITITCRGARIIKLSGRNKAVIEADLRYHFPVFPGLFDQLLSYYQRPRVIIELQGVPDAEVLFADNKKQRNRSASDQDKPGEIYPSERAGNPVTGIINVSYAETNQPAASP